jgi:hypothetical protein
VVINGISRFFYAFKFIQKYIERHWLTSNDEAASEERPMRIQQAADLSQCAVLK